MLQPNDNHMLCEVDDETGELGEELCQEFSVRKRITDLFTGFVTLCLVLWINGIQKFFQMDSGQLVNKGYLTDLARQGLTPPISMFGFEEELQNYLSESAIAADEECTHDKLGFHLVDVDADTKKLVFLADEMIGHPERSSHYCRPEVTAPKGTLDSWKEFVAQEVIGHPHLELALAIGVSGPVVHIFRMNGIYAENPVWALIGRSSTGKTTALRIMASIYGSPVEGQGLIGDLNATENAFFAQLANNIGLPHLIDEATSKPAWNFAAIIYNLSKGEDKARCESNGKPKKRVRFSGPIIISGERSLFEQSTPDLGIYARMVELSFPWVNGASHGRRIFEKCNQNYGTAVKPIAEKLMNILDTGSNILETMFCNELTYFRAAAGSVPAEHERILNMCSTVVVAAQIANEALDINLDIDQLRSLLLQLHQDAPKASNLALELYDAIKDEANRYGNNFSQNTTQKGSASIPFNTWGEYSTHSGKKVLWITQGTFQEFAKRLKLDNFKSLLPDLERQGLMKKFGDRYLTDHNLGHGMVKCYCLILK